MRFGSCVILLLVILVAAPTFVRADSRPYIPVGKAKTKKTVIAIPNVLIKGGQETKRAADKIIETLKNDLLFMDVFRFLPMKAFPSSAARSSGALSQVRFSDWTNSGTELLIKSAISRDGGNLVFEAYLYDTFRGRLLLSKRYVGALNDAVTVGHTVANEIVERLTGLPGIFLTKIAMSCDRTGKKEIYIMNFDGTDVKQITRHRSIAFAPAWSPDGTRIAYSLYNRRKNHVKNIDLYEYNFVSNRIRLLSNRKGINSGATYHPSNGTISLTMSFLGNPEIFSLNTSDRRVTRLTKSFGFDVDPVWDPSGDYLAFVSTRAGKPMIFSMKKDGSQVKRLTYAGRYNATPSWSPQNNKIAFAGMKGGRFDIFIMNPDGTRIERLTRNQGNNEDPSFSPDGNFLVFSSNRTGKKNVYAMNIDGTFVKRLTYGLGNCVAPKWSNPPKR